MQQHRRGNISDFLLILKGEAPPRAKSLFLKQLKYMSQTQLKKWKILNERKIASILSSHHTPLLYKCLSFLFTGICNFYVIFIRSSWAHLAELLGLNAVSCTCNLCDSASYLNHVGLGFLIWAVGMRIVATWGLNETQSDWFNVWHIVSCNYYDYSSWT